MPGIPISKIELTEQELGILEEGSEAAIVKNYIDRFKKNLEQQLWDEYIGTAPDEVKKREKIYLRIKALTMFYEYLSSYVQTAESTIQLIEERNASEQDELGA